MVLGSASGAPARSQALGTYSAHSGLARQRRGEYAAARRRLEALPDGPIFQDIPAVELVRVPSSGTP